MQSVKEQRETHSRLTRLMGSWGRKERQINRLVGQVEGMGAAEGMKPSLFNKLRGLLDQISSLREKERDIISEINAIENKHRLMRKSKKLKRAAPKPLPSWRDEAEAHERRENKKRHNFWVTVLFLWAMSSTNDEKQGPKAG